jgi:hypothetical protein
MFYWKKCARDVRDFVKACTVCQKANYERVASPGLLQPLPTPTSVFSDISMDFVSGLPKSGGRDTILVVVDRFTKYAHFIGLSHPFTAAQVAQLFFDNIFKLHGCPTTIVSDRDPIFLNQFWQDFMKLQGVQLAYSSAYHPQSDGQTEVLNRCLESYLRCMVMDTPTRWFQWLTLAEWWYNTTLHSSIGMSPFEALYGISPPLHIPYIPNDSKLDSIEQLFHEREKKLASLKQSLAKAKNRMKQYADMNRTKRHFSVGDWVYVKLQPYVQNSLKAHRHQKLGPRYFGPFFRYGAYWSGCLQVRSTYVCPHSPSVPCFTVESGPG